MLQCHPYPTEYVDTSKQSSHCAFFMGLQRKQGVSGKEGQQFDIRGTVDEFRHSVSMYMFWKPGMEIYVSHVRRKQLLSFVFPDGHRRLRPSRPMAQEQSGKIAVGEGKVCWDASVEEQLKKKISAEEVGDLRSNKPDKWAAVSPQRLESVSHETSSRSSRTSVVSAGDSNLEILAARNVDNGVVGSVGEVNKENLVGTSKKIDVGSTCGRLEWLDDNMEHEGGLTKPERPISEDKDNSQSIICDESSCENAIADSRANDGNFEGSDSVGSSLVDASEATMKLHMENGCVDDSGNCD